jgi:hypothetical protein
MQNEDTAEKEIIKLTPAELFVANEIKKLCEVDEPHDIGFDKVLYKLVLKISNILNPNVPTVYDTTLAQLQASQPINESEM